MTKNSNPNNNLYYRLASAAEYAQSEYLSDLARLLTEAANRISELETEVFELKGVVEQKDKG